MRFHIAAGIAALVVCMQGLGMQGFGSFDLPLGPTTAYGATVAPPVPRGFMLSPGEYTLAIRLFDAESNREEEEQVEVEIHKGKITLKLNDAPDVSFTGQAPLSTMTFRFGDGRDDVVLRGHLTADDALQGLFVVESFGVGTEHGTFKLTKSGRK